MSSKSTAPLYVIACGDEGVQLNTGVRLGLVGAGYGLDEARDVIKALKKLLKNVFVVSNEENEWVKQQRGLDDWEQVNALMQQEIAALADQWKITYAGLMPFADPVEVEGGVKGHMVRPHGIHIANQVCLTVGGGEQKFHLGKFMVSAEWVTEVDAKLAKSILTKQIEFYQSLVKKPLTVVIEKGGELGEDHAEKCVAVLKKIGIVQ